MDAIFTENKGPKTIYEVSSLAEEDLANNKQEDRKEDIKKNQPSPFKINAKTYHCWDCYMLQHGQTDLSMTQEKRKSKEIDLMIKNSRKQENSGFCMYSLRQESVS